jgi:5S rRNA maturation endonuclease (ribonuclease M5)
MMTFDTILRVKGVAYTVSAANPNEIQLCCVFCQGRGESADKRFRLCINVQNHGGICFNCGWTSRHAVEAVLRRLGHASEAGVAPPPVPVRPPVELEVPPEADLLHKHKADSWWTRRATGYLHGRGVTDADMRKYRILWTEVGHWAYRIVFPVFDEKLHGLVGRSIAEDHRPRYLNSPGPRALWLATHNRDRSTVLLAEGIFKAIALQKYVGTVAAAVLGHTLTPLQVEQLQQWKTQRVVIFPDPDDAGLRGATKMAQQLSSRFDVFLPTILPEAQADEMTAAKIREVAASVTVVDGALHHRYKYQRLIQRMRQGTE